MYSRASSWKVLQQRANEIIVMGSLNSVVCHSQYSVDTEVRRGIPEFTSQVWTHKSWGRIESRDAFGLVVVDVGLGVGAPHSVSAGRYPNQTTTVSPR